MAQEPAVKIATPLQTRPPWARQHLLDLDELSRDEIETVLGTTDAMKEILGREVPRVPALRGRTIVTLFYEASTRTRASFELAGKALGADVINVAAGGSSVEKGESLIDTVRTLGAIGAEVLVMRHPSAGAPYLVARHLSASVVNGGDGQHAHPTQALLDLYTMRAHIGDLRGKRVAIVGDIEHSRVARSNIWGLAAMGAQIVVCGPPTLLPASMRSGAQTPEANRLPHVEVETNIDAAVEGADVVMALRLQTERMARAKTGALVMHPGPMNEGVEISPEVATSLQSVIEEQVTNGVAVRMAILYLLARGKAT